MNLFDPAFLQFIHLLQKHEVKFMLVGGHAVNLYGYSRTTADLDIWVRPTQENAVNLEKAIDEFGFDGSPLLEIDFSQTLVFNVGELPERIEIMNFVSGVTFDEAYPDRKIFELEGQDIPVISLQHLRQNKKASARHRDLDDLEHL